MQSSHSLISGSHFIVFQLDQRCANLFYNNLQINHVPRKKPWAHKIIMSSPMSTLLYNCENTSNHFFNFNIKFYRGRFQQNVAYSQLCILYIPYFWVTPLLKYNKTPDSSFHVIYSALTFSDYRDSQLQIVIGISVNTQNFYLSQAYQ